MSFWKSGSDRYHARHVDHDAPRFDALAGIFGSSRTRKRTLAVVMTAAFGLTTTHIVEISDKPDTNRHIRVGRGVLERCNDTILPVKPATHHEQPVTLHTDKAGNLTGTHINREKLLRQVQPALVSLEQPTGIDETTGKKMFNRWSGVVVKDPAGRSAVVSVGHGLVNGDAPVTVTDAAGHEATVSDGCYIYQTKNKALSIPTYDTAEAADTVHRETADIDLGIFYLDGPIGESALELAAHEPARGDFALFANHPHGEQKVSAFTGVATSVHEPTIEYVTGIASTQETGHDVASITPQLGSSGGAVVNENAKVIGISYGMSEPLTPEQVADYCGVESNEPLTSPVLAVTISSDMIAGAFDALYRDQIPVLAARQ